MRQGGFVRAVAFVSVVQGCSGELKDSAEFDHKELGVNTASGVASARVTSPPNQRARLPAVATLSLEQLRRKPTPAASPEVLVRVRADALPVDERWLARRAGAEFIGTLGGAPGPSWQNRTLRMLLPKGSNVARTIERFRGMREVEYAQENYSYHIAQEAGVPNDPLFPLQWALENDGQPALGGPLAPLPGADLDWLRARELLRTAGTILEPVTVAVLDTGIDSSHEDLTGALWVNPADASEDGRDDDGNGCVDDVHGCDFSEVARRGRTLDDNGHGTHIAGIIGAASGNLLGVAGVAEQVRMIAVKCLGADGVGSTASVVAGLDYAVAQGAQVINVSFIGTTLDPLVERALSDATAAGAFVVVAAGNDALNLDVTPRFPAGIDLPGAVTAAATDRRDRLLESSSFGWRSVDLGAPGDEVISTFLSDAMPYAALSGASIATAHVAGAAAVLYALGAVDGPEGASALLRDTVEPVPDLGCTTTSGGRLDLDALVTMALGLDSTPPSAIGDLAVRLATADTVVLSFTAPSDDGAPARAYDMRSAPASAWTSFDAAERRCGAWRPRAPGSPEYVTVTGLSPATEYRLQVRAVDAGGNGTLSNVVSVTTAPTEPAGALAPALVEPFDNGAAWQLEGSWLVSGGRLGLGIAGLPDRQLAQARLARALDLTEYETVELRYTLSHDLRTTPSDALLLEVSTDGVLWRRVRRFSGTAGLRTESLSLNEYASYPELHIRFVLATGNASSGARVAIDDVSVRGHRRPDECPDDPDKRAPGECGCGVPDVDSDGDAVLDCDDGCPTDGSKLVPGTCGCGVPDEDSDANGVTDCLDACFGVSCDDGVACTIDRCDATGACEHEDVCPTDPAVLVSRDAVWRYLDIGSEPSGWTEPDFDDAAWSSGPAELGYGDGDEATLVQQGPSTARFITTYFRHEFEVNDPTAITSLTAGIVRDDGAIVYLNGVEVARTNMPAGAVTFETLASTAVGGAAEAQVQTTPIEPSLLRVGRNVMAVEVHQNAASSSDLSFSLELQQLSDRCPDDPDKTLPGECGCGTPDTDNDANGVPDCREPCAPARCDDQNACTTESCDENGSCVHVYTCPGVPRGGEWLYLDDGSDPGSAWRELEFDASGWNVGRAELGYGDGDEVTTVSFGADPDARFITTYFRREFELDAEVDLGAGIVDLVRDDGAVVYINGVEVFRSNMPAGAIAFDTLASSAINGAGESTVLSTPVPPGVLRTGRNVVAVEVHQRSADSSDVSFDLALRFDEGPSFPLPAGPVLLAAGDIGDCATTGDTWTSALLDARPGPVAVLGDIAYPNGSATNFAECFDPVWGRHRARLRPVPGNHEYVTASASAYFDYFGDAAAARGQGYYSFDIGDWHVVALNSNCAEIDDETGAADGCAEGSAQLEWLRADLAANPRACTLAFTHHPRWSSGQHGDNAMVAPLWSTLVEASAEIVLSGHDHDYERTVPLDATGAPSSTGVVQFVVGTGGTSLRSFDVSQPSTTAVRSSAAHGVLELELLPGAYNWRFIPISGQTFTDFGTAGCH